MKMKIYRTSDIWSRAHEKPYEGAIQADDKSYVIEINTLEELLEIAKNTGQNLVIGLPFVSSDLPFIEIYDDYRE